MAARTPTAAAKTPRRPTRKTPPPPRRTPRSRAVTPPPRSWWTSKRLLLAAAAVATAVIATATLLRTTHTAGQQSETAPLLPATSLMTALTVDGQPIPVRQFTLQVDAHRAETFDHFQQTYHAGDTADFWQTQFGDTTPTAYLIQQAVTDTVRIAVERRLGHQHGLLADPGYPAFLSAWTAENKRRATALAAHQVIYGPTQYSESDYFTYLLGNVVYSLEQALVSDGTVSADEATIRAYYLAHPEKFQQPPRNGPTARSPGPYPLAPFEAVEPQAKQLCLDDAFQAYITAAAARATVLKAESVLAHIPVR